MDHDYQSMGSQILLVWLCKRGMRERNCETGIYWSESPASDQTEMSPYRDSCQIRLMLSSQGLSEKHIFSYVLGLTLAKGSFQSRLSCPVSSSLFVVNTLATYFQMESSDPFPHVSNQKPHKSPRVQVTLIWFELESSHLLLSRRS